MDSSILITGSTGNVGTETARALYRLGENPRLADLSLLRVKERFGDQVEAVDLDFSRPETYGPALTGVQKVFLMRPPAITDIKRLICPFIDAAARSGVRQVVFLSLVGVEKNRLVPHHKIEKYLLTSGMGYTFLRPSFFMQNLSTTHRDEIRLRNEISVPAGRGKTSFIDVRDIAAVAALALTQPGYANQAFELTGSEALDYYEVAEQFSQVLGRKITYRNPSALAFIRHQRQHGTPLAFALVMSVLYSVSRVGLAGGLTGEVKRLLGRDPITMRQFIEDYRGCWES